MEMNMRDWMIVIGVLLFLLVVLDGYRRAQRERKNQVRMSRKAEKLRFPEDEPTLSELPNGGNKRIAGVQSAKNNNDGNDPLFCDPFERDNAVVLTSAPPSLQNESERLDELEITELESLSTTQGIDSRKRNEPFAESTRTADASSAENSFIEPEPLVDLQGEFFDRADMALRESQQEQTSQGEGELFDKNFDELLLMYVVAQAKHGLKQSEVMHILQQCDLRLNSGSIFERFEQPNGQGAVQFRVANATETGRFMMNEEDESLLGITFFMQLPGPERAIEAFEAMVAVAQCVADNLHGLLKDELHSTMTEQTLQHCRQRIKDYLQQQLIKHG